MKKKITAFLLCMTLVLSVSACKKAIPAGPDIEPPDGLTENTETSEAVTEEEGNTDSLMGFNMIENGDFSGDDFRWMTYTESGGDGSISYENEALNVKVLKVGSVEHAMQIYYDGFSLEKGCVYEIQFDASSTVEKQIQYRIQINGGDYHAYTSEYLTLTPEVQHFDITFTMEEDSDPAPRLCFNMGLFDGAELEKHFVTFDNFELYCTDESGRVVADSDGNATRIQVNQVGYLPNDTKTAVFCGDDLDAKFNVIDVSNNQSVYEGSVGAGSFNENTGQNEAAADFTSVTKAGTYKIVGEKCGESYEFTIGEDVYKEAFKDSLKMFYLQRCGAVLPEEYAGEFAHGACHAEKATIYGTDKKIDVSGGWHDAGDYGRYTVSGVKAVADLLISYEKYPDAFDDNVGIPESGNGIPDVLDEARYELEWLFKMQDSEGGVYHKVTCANFPGMVMPEEETEELLVLPVATPATGDFAAVMAMAYEVYADVDKAFADKCLAASKKAAAYLDTHEAKRFTNPKDVLTGEYPDNADIDERFWAYAELFKATGDAKYEQALKQINTEKLKPGFGWADVTYYGAYAYLTSNGLDSDLKEKATDILKTGAEQVISDMSKDTYGCSIYHNYVWGSNMLVGDYGKLLSLYGEVAGKDYAKETKMQLDYLLGNNGLSYCYLTGYGTKTPDNTHHRPSQALGKTMPGMIVGGPNSNLEDPYAQQVLKDRPDALCYADNSQSYSCNEITVYWNSPLIYLFAECEGLK